MIEVDNNFYTILITFTFSLVLILICSKNNILIDQVLYSKHKNLIKNHVKSPPLCGGIIIFICSIFFFNNLFLLNTFGLSFLILGIFSDTNKLSSPIKRILFQFVILFSFIILSKLIITDLRIDVLNYFLKINFISIIFTIFCILVLINGSNFLDGLNTLVLGYYIMVSSFLILLSINYDLIIDNNIKLLIIFLIILFFFNFFGKVYLGDSGAYLIGFYISFFVIDFYLSNSSVSPYFICLLLWYPAFENLFSIIRRVVSKSKVEIADQHHLHQMMYSYFIKKNIIKNIFINTFVANLINIYNLSIFICFYRFYSNTQILITGIFFNVLIYLIMYFFLKKKTTEIYKIND